MSETRRDRQHSLKPLVWKNWNIPTDHCLLRQLVPLNRNAVHKRASLKRTGTFLLPAGDLARPNNCYLSTDITGWSDESKLLVAKKYFRRRSKGNEREKKTVAAHTTGFHVNSKWLIGNCSNVHLNCFFTTAWNTRLFCKN